MDTKTIQPDTSGPDNLDAGRVADVDQAHAAALEEQKARARQQRADDLADGLCRFAEMVKATPEFAPLFASMLKRLRSNHLHSVGDDAAAVLAAFARVSLKHGAKVAKSGLADGEDAKYFDVTASWGPVAVVAWTMREEVCERVVTGMETVTEEVPDPEALAAVPTVTRTREVETFEWVCKPLLAAASCPCGKGAGCGCGLVGGAGELAAAGTQVSA